MTELLLRAAAPRRLTRRRLENQVKDPEDDEQSNDEDDRHEPQEYFHFLLQPRVPGMTKRAWREAGSSDAGAGRLPFSVFFLLTGRIVFPVNLVCGFAFGFAFTAGTRLGTNVVVLLGAVLLRVFVRWPGRFPGRRFPYRMVVHGNAFQEKCNMDCRGQVSAAKFCN